MIVCTCVGDHRGAATPRKSRRRAAGADFRARPNRQRWQPGAHGGQRWRIPGPGGPKTTPGGDRGLKTRPAQHGQGRNPRKSAVRLQLGPMAATLPERIALARPGFLPPGPETRYLLTPRAGGRVKRCRDPLCRDSLGSAGSRKPASEARAGRPVVQRPGGLCLCPPRRFDRWHTHRTG